jgi:flagellar motor switch/type III secretory pathway protein FliN
VVPFLRREEAELATWLAAALAAPWRGAVGARLVRVDRWDEGRSGPWSVAVPVFGESWTAALVLSEGLARKWTAAMLDDPATELAAPRPLTVIERGLASLLAAAAAEELGVATTRIGEADEASRVRGWIGEGWAAEIDVSFGARLGTGWLVAGRDAIRRMPRRPSPDGPRVPIRVPVQLGRTRVALSSLAALERRDVITVPPRPRLAVAKGGFPVTIEAARTEVRVVGPYAAEGAGMDPVLAGELPVELSLELGRVVLSAAEVLALAPGAVVTVPRPTGGLVDVVAGGRVVARGELVDVEGGIGVRVTEISR